MEGVDEAEHAEDSDGDGRRRTTAAFIGPMIGLGPDWSASCTVGSALGAVGGAAAGVVHAGAAARALST